MNHPAVRRGSPPQQSFAATFQCRGTPRSHCGTLEVPLGGCRRLGAASYGAGKRGCANSSNSQTFRTDMHTVSATHSLSNCFSPVCPLNEFRYCSAIKV